MTEPADRGTNERQPAPDAILAVNFAKFLRAEGELSEAKAEHKSVRKHVAAKGLNLKAAAVAAKILGKGSAATAEYVALFGDVLALLKIGGEAVTADQMDMFAVVDPRATQDEKAFEAGRNAAFFGKGTEANPYDVASRPGQEWLAGLAEGRAEVDLIMAMEPGEGSELIKGSDDPGFPDEMQEAAE